MLTGMLSTKPVEDTLNRLRHSERVHKASKLGRTARWHKAVHTDVMPDCDRPRLPTFATSVSGTETVPSTLFEAHRGQWSLGETARSLVLEGPKHWASPRPDQGYQAVFASTSLLDIGPDVDALSKVWLSMLLPLRSVCVHRGTKEVGLVISATRHGALLVPLRNRKVGNVRMYRPDFDGASSAFRQVSVMDERDWFSVSVEAWTGPYFFSRLGEEARRLPQSEQVQCKGLVMISRERPRPVVEATATKGFQGLTVPELKRLLLRLGVSTKPQPSTERECVVALLEHIFPTATDEEREDR